jgi:hypothetical protein
LLKPRMKSRPRRREKRDIWMHGCTKTAARRLAINVDIDSLQRSARVRLFRQIFSRYLQLRNISESDHRVMATASKNFNANSRPMDVVGLKARRGNISMLLAWT